MSPDPAAVACSMAARNISGGWAPEIATLPLMTKNGTPEMPSLCPFCSHRRTSSDPRSPASRLVHLARVEPALDRHRRERRPVGQVAAVGEVRLEQRLHHGVLHALLTRQPDDPVGVERVRGAGHPLGVERESLAGERPADLGVQFERPLPAPELLDPVGPPLDALAAACPG